MVQVMEAAESLAAGTRSSRDEQVGSRCVVGMAEKCFGREHSMVERHNDCGQLHQALGALGNISARKGPFSVAASQMVEANILKQDWAPREHLKPMCSYTDPIVQAAVTETVPGAHLLAELAAR